MEESDSYFSKIWSSSNEKPSTTLRFFERQEYYTVHYEDASFIAKNYFKSLEVIKYFKGIKNCPYVTISKTVSPSLFQFLLIRNHYKIEVYSCQGRDTSSWNLLYTVSPGNLERYHDVLFPNTDIVASNNLVAINIKKMNDLYRVYVGFVDLDNNQMVVGYFDENYGEYKQLSNLNSVLFQLNCRECLIPKSGAQSTRNPNKSVAEADPLVILRNTITQNGLLCSEIDKSQFESSMKDIDEFSITKLISRIERFTNIDKVSSNESLLRELIDRESIEAANCLLAVITYLSLESKDSDEDNLGCFEIKSLKLDNYMKITESCSQALNILPNNSISNNESDTKSESLYSLLNHCKTQLGERLLMQWLRQPLMDVRQINNRLDIVELLFRESTIRNNLHDNYLSRIPDLQRIIRRIQRKTVTLQDLYKLYLALKQVSNIEKLFDDYEGLHRHVLHSEITVHLNDLLKETANFVSMLESTLDFEAIKSQEYKIKPDIDEGLMEKFEEANQLKCQMEKEFKKVAGYLDLEPNKQIKLESNGHLGYYLRITRKEEKVLRDKRNISIKETQKDGVKFYSNTLEVLNEDYKRISNEYEQMQKSIVMEIVNVSGEYLSALQKLSSMIARIDVLCSLSITAITAPCTYTRPKLLEISPTDVNEEPQRHHIKLTGCRHALVEMQPGVASYIPNDVEFHENRSFHIITGPNMGGKSTYIRSVGLVVVLSQIGSFIPCESAEIRVCDRIMTRIGAGDCQIKGVSTFMAEMLDVSWILKDCTKNSLVIIDELGRGTSTFDGFGLAWSISEFLATQKRAYCMFATHFHELTTLADLHPNKVANLSVSAQTMDEDLVFLYKVLEGAATKSYGIELAKLVGLPDDVIEMSREKLKEYEYEEKFLFDEEKLKRQKDVVRNFCSLDLDECTDLETLRTEVLQSLTESH